VDLAGQAVGTEPAAGPGIQWRTCLAGNVLYSGVG